MCSILLNIFKTIYLPLSLPSSLLTFSIPLFFLFLSSFPFFPPSPPSPSCYMAYQHFFNALLFFPFTWTVILGHNILSLKLCSCCFFIFWIIVLGKTCHANLICFSLNVHLNLQKYVKILFENQFASWINCRVSWTTHETSKKR